MRTQKQIEAAQRNGLRSRGPATPEGKQRSSRNAITHGLSAKVVVLSNESADEYNRLLSSYVAYWKPATEPEFDLVHDIVANRWRLNRTLAIESATLDLEIDNQRAHVDETYSKMDEPTRCALAFSELVDNGCALTTLGRHETRLRRAMHRASAELRRLQAVRRPGSEIEIFTNEPGNASA